jgi:hypothetical protein
MTRDAVHPFADPLDRFVAIWERLEPGRGWWESGELLRHSALAVTTSPGAPRDVADELVRTAAALKDSEPWYQRSSVGVLLAAWLVRTRRSVADLSASIERAKPHFRAKWRFSGGTSEAVAILILADASPGREVGAAEVGRLAAIYDAVRADHPLLTQKSDWPLCALLAHLAGEPASIARRVEALYAALHAGGASRGDRLQDAAFILALCDGEPSVLAARFQALFDAFGRAGLRMVSDDYDEVASLCFVDAPPARVVEVVLRHRERITALKPKPGKQTSFSLAAGTALLELAHNLLDPGRAVQADSVARILSILAAQRAVVAAMAGASAAT